MTSFQFDLSSNITSVFIEILSETDQNSSKTSKIDTKFNFFLNIFTP